MSLTWHPDWELQPYNTFGLSGRARWFAQVRHPSELAEVRAWMQQTQLPVRVLGSGSNVLLSGDVEAIVIQLMTQDIRIESEQEGETVVLTAEAGVIWQHLVEHSLDLGLSGLENLSLIPGTVGAAPVQNIGAYGVELCDLCDGVTAFHWPTGQVQEFSVSDCAFEYRDSIFKRQANHWCILRVRFRLSRSGVPECLDYGVIRQYLTQRGIDRPSAREVSQIICQIRMEKLPDPNVLGNAGSFFKNPVVSVQQAHQLKERYPNVVCYPQAQEQVKLAAAWLIERAGWKGKRIGSVGVHHSQPLVLVNYGQATGAEVLAVAHQIQADVWQQFGVRLEQEPVLF